MTQTELNGVLRKHVLYLNGDQSGECADLGGANLRDACLRGANLDYASWPLSCGSLDVIVDKRIFCQLAYHLCRVVVDDPECKAAQRALYPIANQFHRVDGCGRLGYEKK